MWQRASGLSSISRLPRRADERQDNRAIHQGDPAMKIDIEYCGM